MICLNCGAEYSETDTRDGYYFASASVSIGSYSDPAEIAALGEEITHCPRCPLPHVDEAMREGDRTAEGGY